MSFTDLSFCVPGPRSCWGKGLPLENNQWHAFTTIAQKHVSCQEGKFRGRISEVDLRHFTRRQFSQILNRPLSKIKKFGTKIAFMDFNLWTFLKFFSFWCIKLSAIKSMIVSFLLKTRTLFGITGEYNLSEALQGNIMRGHKMFRDIGLW